jgi:hypothetical protein
LVEEFRVIVLLCLVTPTGNRYSLIGRTSNGNGGEGPPHFDPSPFPTVDSSWSDHPSGELFRPLQPQPAVGEQRKALRRHSKYENHKENGGDSSKGKARPKSMIYLDPKAIPVPGSLKAKARSCRSVRGGGRGRGGMRYGSEEDDEADEGVDAVHEENALLRNELRSLRARNNRLIDQLRQKSMQISRLEASNTRLEAEVSSIRREEKFNELMGRHCLWEQMVKKLNGVFSPLEVKLNEFESDVRALRAGFARAQQGVGLLWREWSGNN